MGEKHTSAATGSDKRSYKSQVLKCAKIVAKIVGYTLDLTGTGELYTTLGLLLIKLCIKAVSAHHRQNRKQPSAQEIGKQKQNEN